jgi:hypothetical protein
LAAFSSLAVGAPTIDISEFESLLVCREPAGRSVIHHELRRGFKLLFFGHADVEILTASADRSFMFVTASFPEPNSFGIGFSEP